MTCRFALMVLLGLAALSGCATAGVGRPGGAGVANAWKAFREHPTSGRPFIDFSSAGAFFGDRGIPDTARWRHYRVADFGAITDDAQDDTAAIQRTIDAAALGGGGVVLFGPGRYLVHTDRSGKPIRISASRIALKGDRRGRTVLYMANAMPPDEPDKIWTGPSMFTFAPARQLADPPTAIPVATADQGDDAITVNDARGFARGDYVLLRMQSTRANGTILQGKIPRSIWTDVRDRGVALADYHRIRSVVGNRITFDRPLLSPVDASWPWTLKKVAMIEQVGFEYLCVETSFTEKFEHHKDARHDSGFNAVSLVNTADSWVTNSCFRNVTAPVVIRGGMANSILLNRIEGNPGHFGMQVEYGTRNLIGLTVDATRGGQFHGPSVAHEANGNVIWRYFSPDGAGIDAHGNSPRDTLFDLVTMSGFGAWGGHYTNLPNHLDGLVFWNFRQTGRGVGDGYKGTLDFWQYREDDPNPWTFMTAVNPVIAGYEGPIARVKADTVSSIEGLGHFVSPHSLYEAQLERRLGTKPGWMTRALSQWTEARRRDATGGGAR